MSTQASPSAPSRAIAISTVLATMLACMVLLVALGHKPLTAWDEGIYAEVSREMLGGSWLVPHWNAQVWFEKPPLMLWITATFFKLLGVHEFTARAGSALSGVALVAVVHRWLLIHRSGFAAWLSTVILLSTFGFLHICSLGEMDVMLSLGCIVALLGLAKVQAGERSGWYGFWIGFAIALMTKGAASITLLLTLLVAALIERRQIARFAKQFVRGCALFLALVLPWHIALYHLYGQVFLREYLGFHVLSRATVQIEGHITHPWYYLGVLLFSAPPWVLLYPFALVAAFRTTESRPLRVLAVFALVEFCFFTAIQTRLPHYIAPAYPVLTLISAVYAAEKLRAWRVPQQSVALRSAWVVGAVAVFGLTSLATASQRKKLHSARLTRGALPPDSHEMAQLLKDVRRRNDLPDGPLLAWSSADSFPIAPAVFYAERPVQQVQLLPAPADMPRDKYIYDPQTLNDAATAAPRLLLLDRSLLTSLPANIAFTPMEQGKTLAVGTVTSTR